MKILLAFICFSLTNIAFAQDGYHLDSTVQCENNESCLISFKSNYVIKFIDGFGLSSDSYLADTVFSGAQICFHGDPREVCSLMDIMSTIDGGHATISNFNCAVSERLIKLKYDLEYDGYGKEFLNFEIKNCE